MDANLNWSLLALAFFTASLFCWTYSWWNRDRASSLVAFVAAIIFTACGFGTLVVWAVTHRWSAR